MLGRATEIWRRFAVWRDVGTVADLPRRVREAIEHQSRDSERLVGWTQLLLVATFAVLYLVSPRPGDAGLLAPVPVVLSLYAGFTVLRLVLCHRRRLSEPLVIVSIVVDIGLLLALIWTFHIAYEQPAAFSLKVPTFIYVFVFIALRALRFEYRYVLIAGASAAVGWLVLTLLAIRGSGPEAVTRSFVASVTGNRILIGAEVDKIIAIVMLTGILALAVWRAQVTLVKAVREETAAREIGRFLSSGVAQVIASADTRIEAGTVVARQAAILMLDIRGFSKLSATLPPAELVHILSNLHARVIPIVRQHGGVIDKFLGDGIMATFGAVVPNATPEADAMRAFEAVMDAAARWSDETGIATDSGRLMVNGGLAAGPVVLTTLGSGDRLEYTVIGDAVNLAAKLEKHNKTAKTRALVDAATYDRAIAQGYAPAIRHARRRAEEPHGVEHSVDLVVLRA